MGTTLCPHCHRKGLYLEKYSNDTTCLYCGYLEPSNWAPPFVDKDVMVLDIPDGREDNGQYMKANRGTGPVFKAVITARLRKG